MNRHLLSIFTAVALIAAHTCAHAADRPPVESFFAHPDVDFVTLSPSGRYIALLNRLSDGKQALVVRETADLKKVTTVSMFDSLRLRELAWINDNRLTLTLKNTQIEFEGDQDA